MPADVAQIDQAVGVTTLGVGHDGMQPFGEAMEIGKDGCSHSIGFFGRIDRLLTVKCSESCAMLLATVAASMVTLRFSRCL